MTTHRRHRWAWALAGLLLVHLPSVAADDAPTDDTAVPVLRYQPGPVGERVMEQRTEHVREAYGEPSETVSECRFTTRLRWTEDAPGERFRVTVEQISHATSEEGPGDTAILAARYSSLISLDPDGAFTDGAGWTAWWEAWPEPLRADLEARRPDAPKDALEQEGSARRPGIEREARRLSTIRHSRIGLPATPGACRSVPSDGAYRAWLDKAEAVPGFPPLAGVTWDEGTQCVAEIAPCTDAPGAPTCAVVVEHFEGRPSYVPLKPAADAAADALADGALYMSEFKKASNRRIELTFELRTRVEVDTLWQWGDTQTYTDALYAKGGEGDILIRSHRTVWTTTPAD